MQIIETQIHEKPQIIIILFLLSLIMFSCASDDDNGIIENVGCTNTTYNGNLELNTQNDVDNFINNYCEIINGTLTIIGDNITDLGGLQNLT